MTVVPSSTHDFRAGVDTREPTRRNVQCTRPGGELRPRRGSGVISQDTNPRDPITTFLLLLSSYSVSRVFLCGGFAPHIQSLQFVDVDRAVISADAFRMYYITRGRYWFAGTQDNDTPPADWASVPHTDDLSGRTIPPFRNSKANSVGPYQEFEERQLAPLWIQEPSKPNLCAIGQASNIKTNVLERGGVSGIPARGSLFAMRCFQILNRNHVSSEAASFDSRVARRRFSVLSDR
jgi:hypothetical protein